MADLVKRLCEAERPDRVLDAEIWCFAEGFRFDAMTPDGGFVLASFQLQSGRWHQTNYEISFIPEYTGSLDAALPGEEIIMVTTAPDYGWLAFHEDAGGGKYQATAKTEALARRAAALSDPAIGGW